MRAEEIRRYFRIHEWLSKTYGKANHCDFCNAKNRKYSWALKKEMEYAFNRNHFHQLCYSCHIAYDVTDAKRKKHSENMKVNVSDSFKFAQKGKMGSLSNSSKKIISISENGDIEYFEGLSDAYRKYGYKISTLSMCLTGRNKTAYNKRWKYDIQGK